MKYFAYHVDEGPPDIVLTDHIIDYNDVIQFAIPPIRIAYNLYFVDENKEDRPMCLIYLYKEANLEQ